MRLCPCAYGLAMTAWLGEDTAEGGAKWGMTALRKLNMQQTGPKPGFFVLEINF